MKHRHKWVLQIGKGNPYTYFYCGECEIYAPKDHWVGKVHKKINCNEYKNNLEIRKKAEGRAVKTFG